MRTDSFSLRFELYELDLYIFAKKNRRLAEDEFKDLEEAMYEDAPMVKVCYNHDEGRMYFGSGGSVEDFVIDMIERKEAFLKQLNRLREREELFDMAMDTLTPREKDVIRVHYFNRENNLGLSLDFFQEVLTDAQTKLCSFLGEEQFNRESAAQAEHKAQLIEQADEWKRSRKIS